MPDERAIRRIEELLVDITRLGGENERTSIVPNLTVVDAAPTGLTNFITVADDRDGDTILAKKVPGIIYAVSDKVNVLFIEGTEPIAYQQGSESSSGNLWEIVPSTSTDIFYDKGQVGISTTGPNDKLEIICENIEGITLTKANTVLQESTNFVIGHSEFIDQEDAGGAASRMLFKAGNDKFDIINEAGNEFISTFESTEINFFISNAKKMTIDSNGDVGIGTASPAVKFHILDTANFFVRFEANAATAFCNLQVQADVSGKHLNTAMFGSTFAGTQFGAARANTASLFADQCLLTFGTKSSFDLIIGTNNAEAMRIDTSRDVGIGTTGPTAQLHVDQSGTATAQPVLKMDQADVSEEFIGFIGAAAAATLTQSLVDEGDVTTATRIGFFKIDIDDVGNQITDGTYFVPFFSLA